MFPISWLFFISQKTSLFFLKTNKQTKTPHNASCASFSWCAPSIPDICSLYSRSVRTAPGQRTDLRGLAKALWEAHCFSRPRLKCPRPQSEPMLYLLRHTLRGSRTLWLTELAGWVTPCHWPVKPTPSGETVLLFLKLRTWCSGKLFWKWWPLLWDSKALGHVLIYACLKAVRHSKQ